MRPGESSGRMRSQVAELPGVAVQPPVTRADAGSGNSDPLRVIPEVGKVTKYGSECAEKRLSVSVSHASESVSSGDVLRR